MCVTTPEPLMLNAISDFFQRTLAQPEQRENQTLTLELATAALLCEIVRADYDTTDEELAALRLMLTERYLISTSDVEELMTQLWHKQKWMRPSIITSL